MARLIDAENLKGFYEPYKGLDVPCEEVCRRIDSQPTADAVEVVRCKDCRFNVGNMETDPLDATDYSDITCSYFMTDGMEPDDFCSRGAKMDGGENNGKEN